MTLFSNSLTVHELISQGEKNFNAQDSISCLPPEVEEGKNIRIASLQPGKKAINVIGRGVCIECGSEFSQVMSAAGIGPVRHISDCLRFDDFCFGGGFSYNVLIEAGARPIADYMKESWGIPYCYAPHSYWLESISENYCRLESFLDVKLPTTAYRAEAEQAIGCYRRLLGGISLAVGEAANANPFELARALVAYGFKVPYIFSLEPESGDREHIAWLAAQTPETRIFTNTLNGVEQRLKVDLALGLKGEFFYPGTRTINPINRYPYGYQGVVALLREMTTVMNNPHLRP